MFTSPNWVAARCRQVSMATIGDCLGSPWTKVGGLSGISRPSSFNVLIRPEVNPRSPTYGIK